MRAGGTRGSSRHEIQPPAALSNSQVMDRHCGNARPDQAATVGAVSQRSDTRPRRPCRHTNGPDIPPSGRNRDPSWPETATRSTFEQYRLSGSTLGRRLPIAIPGWVPAHPRHSRPGAQATPAGLPSNSCPSTNFQAALSIRCLRRIVPRPAILGA